MFSAQPPRCSARHASSGPPGQRNNTLLHLPAGTNTSSVLLQPFRRRTAWSTPSPSLSKGNGTRAGAEKKHGKQHVLPAMSRKHNNSVNSSGWVVPQSHELHTALHRAKGCHHHPPHQPPQSPFCCSCIYSSKNTGKITPCVLLQLLSNA